jgi:hypothetical protein
LKSSIIQRLDAPRWTVAITAVVYLVFILLRLAAAGNDPSIFILAGDKFVNSEQAPEDLKVLTVWPDGYDGQFFYRLALDPFTTKVTDFGIRLDNPTARQDRIVYPTLVWLLSLGRADLVPWLLIAVNYVALCVIGWIGSTLAQSMGRHAGWGMVFPLYPGFLFTLACDTAEILEVVLVLTSLWLLLRQRPGLATVALTLAVLTKSPALLVAVGAMLIYLRERWKRTGVSTIKWYYFVVPGAVFICWQVFLLSRWQQVPVLAASFDLGWPLADFLSYVVSALKVSAPFRTQAIAEMIFVVMMIIAPLSLLRSAQAPLHIKVTWVLYGLLATLYTTMIWVTDTGFFRALADFYLFGMWIVLSAASAIRWPVAIYSMGVWVYSFLPTARLS